MRTLWRWLRRKRKPKAITFKYDVEISQKLKRLAEDDGKPEGEVASSLLKQGISRRRRRDPASDAWASLTQREQEIVALHQLGYSRRQIAAALGIAHNTVSTHMRKILIQLGLDTPEDLLALYAHWNFSDWVEENDE